MAEDFKLCRCCRKRDIDKSKPDTYIQTSKTWYYHVDCYKDFISKKTDVKAMAEEDDWKSLLWDYLTRDIKLPKANYCKFENQWNSFLYKDKKKMTAKGLFFACRYFYEVMHGNKEEAQGGIGILPYVYDNSCAYWKAKSVDSRSICEKIEEQIATQETRKIVEVVQRTEKKRKETLSLSDLMQEEDNDTTR